MASDKIGELIPQEFNKNEIDNCLHVEYHNNQAVSIVKMSSVFDWIKERSIESGLTVKMEGDKIMFINSHE